MVVTKPPRLNLPYPTFSTRAGVLNPAQFQPRQRQSQHTIRFGVAFCMPHKPIQLAVQCRAPSIRSYSLRRTCLPCACSHASNLHHIGAAASYSIPCPAAAPTAARMWTRSYPPHQIHSTLLPKASFPHSIHIQRELRLSPRLTPTYVLISSSDMTLTPTCRCRHAASNASIALRAFLPTNIWSQA